MPDWKQLKNKARLWVFAILTALGVGSYQAAQLLGCESGAIDDAKTVPVFNDAGVAVGEKPNPNAGECVEFK